MPLSLHIPAAVAALCLGLISGCGGETNAELAEAELDRAVTCAAAFAVRQRGGDPQAAELADRWGRMAFNYTPRGQLFASGYIDSINHASRLSSREPERFDALLSECALALNEATAMEESRVVSPLTEASARHLF